MKKLVMLSIALLAAVPAFSEVDHKKVVNYLVSKELGKQREKERNILESELKDPVFLLVDYLGKNTPKGKTVIDLYKKLTDHSSRYYSFNDIIKIGETLTTSQGIKATKQLQTILTKLSQISKSFATREPTTTVPEGLQSAVNEYTPQIIQLEIEILSIQRKQAHQPLEEIIEIAKQLAKTLKDKRAQDVDNIVNELTKIRTELLQHKKKK